MTEVQISSAFGELLSYLEVHQAPAMCNTLLLVKPPEHTRQCIATFRRNPDQFIFKSAA